MTNRKSLHVPGGTLSYTLEGAGPPLLVVGSSLYYPRTFSRNLRRSYTLVCLDLPHFTNLGDDFDRQLIGFDSYAENIEAVRAAEGLGQVVVIGHSHHGNVALEYAKRYPQRVSHVVMIGSPPADIPRTVEEAGRYWAAHAAEGRKLILQKRRKALDEKRLAALSPMEAYIAQYVADAPLYWNDPNYNASWLWQGMIFNMRTIHAFRDLYRQYEFSWDGESLRIPLLVVMGEQDYAVPHTLWEGVLPELQKVTFRLLRNSGHTPQLEQADEFDGNLHRWITSETGTRFRRPLP